MGLQHPKAAGKNRSGPGRSLPALPWLPLPSWQPLPPTAPWPRRKHSRSKSDEKKEKKEDLHLIFHNDRIYKQNLSTYFCSLFSFSLLLTLYFLHRISTLQ